MDDTTGAVSWTIEDTSGKSVTLDDLASNTALTELKTQVTNNNTTINETIGNLDKFVVKYDKDKTDENKPNYNSVTMGGTKYVPKGTEIEGGGKTTTSEGGTKITNVAYSDGTKSDAVNVEYLEDEIAKAKTDLTGKGFALEDEAGNKVEKDLGEAITVVGDKGINVSASNTDGKVTVSLDSNITVGKDGKDGTKGEQGHIGLAGADGTNGLDGTTLVDIRTEKGEPGLNGTDGITRVIYKDKDGDHQVATLDDGLLFGGDSGDTIAKKLNEKLEIKGGATGTLTEGNIGVVSEDGILKVKLAEALTGITSISNGGTTITINGTGLDVGGKKITNVADGSVDSDAVNYGQLQKAIEDSKTDLTGKGFALEDEAGNKVEKDLGEAITVVGDKGINVSASSTDGKVTVSLENDITVGTKGEDGKDGEQGHIGLAGKDGEDGIDGKDGNIVDIHIEKGKNGEKGEDGKDGEMGANGVDGTDGITRIVYTDAKGDHQVATLEDGLMFKGDDATVIKKKLNNQLDIIGGADGTLTDNNIGVVSDNGKLHVKLAEALTNIKSITNGTTTITLKEDSVDVGGKQITDVAAGEKDTDAVNMSQLKAMETKIQAGAVMYDSTTGKEAYKTVTLGGKDKKNYSRTENKDKDGNVTSVTYTGGTTITNVSYAEVAERGKEGYDGSQAVNMDRLNDSIDAAMSQVKTDVTGAEKHIQAKTYEIVDGKVTLQLVDGNETEISGKDGKVVINDVAKATDIGTVNGTEGHKTEGDGILKDDLRPTEKDKDGNITYGKTTVVDAINKVDDKVEEVKTDVTNLKKDFNDYKSETNTKIENINTNIQNLTEDLDRRVTKVTVNGNQEEGNLKLKTTTEDEGKKVTFDVSLSDKVTLGTGENTVTLDGEKGEASISKKLNVGGTDGITIEKLKLGKYTEDVKDADGTEHKAGDTMSGYSTKGLANTTTYYEGFADGTGKAATEEQLKEALGAMDFSTTIINEGETVNKYNIVNTATNVTEAVYKLDQSLSEANTRIDNNTINIQKLDGSLGKLNTRVNRVGAGAAALAALHPLDFDPDDKWDFAAGYGNYAGANATAIGAYYRPNEDTMFSLAGSFGGGENMVNAGVSLKLGRGNHVTTSKVAMAKEIKELRNTVAAQGEQIAQLTALVEKLAGEKLTAPEAPAPAETFTVDTVKEDDGKPVIERVRTVKGA